jgi:hypothetical protein
LPRKVAGRAAGAGPSRPPACRHELTAISVRRPHSPGFRSTSAREFDLFAVDVDGKNLERVTTYEGFDSFPIFSPDGRWLVFASNRGGSKQGETNLFVAEWR